MVKYTGIGDREIGLGCVARSRAFIHTDQLARGHDSKGRISSTDVPQWAPSDRTPVGSPMNARMSLAAIPPVIWTLWLQGQLHAPSIVRTSFARWRKLNPDLELRVLDRGDAENLLHDFPIKIEDISAQALSDILRARLLRDNGGIWVDATAFPTIPLHQWLGRHSGQGFFAFERPGPDRPIASWFIAATRGHSIMRRWWNEIVAYWSKKRTLRTDLNGGVVIPADPQWEMDPSGGARGDTYPYFWFHYLFGRLIENDAHARRIWSQVPKLSAVPSHALQFLIARQPDADTPAIIDAVFRSPVQKLNWRQSYPIKLLADLEGTVAVGPSDGENGSELRAADRPER